MDKAVADDLPPGDDKGSSAEKNEDLKVRYISLEEARGLGGKICSKYCRAFELLKDK